MAGLLYGVSPYDLSTFAGVTAGSPPSPSPPVTSRRCAPCASIRSLLSTPNDFWHCSRLVFRRCCHPNDRFGMLMSSPHTGFQRMCPQWRRGSWEEFWLHAKSPSIKSSASRLETCLGLKSPVENTWPRCSYPELTMHSGSQLACSERCSQKGILMGH
jgi:hypothetical protein